MGGRRLFQFLRLTLIALLLLSEVALTVSLLHQWAKLKQWQREAPVAPRADFGAEVVVSKQYGSKRW